MKSARGLAHPIPKEASKYLYTIGTAFLGVFIVQVIFGLLPFKPTLPQWQVNLAQTLYGNGPIALIGACLVALSVPLRRNYVNQSGSKPIVNLVNKFAGFAALAWLALIPLQVFAGHKVIHNMESSRLDQVKRVEKIRNAIVLADTKEKLESLATSLPEAPPNLDIKVPFPVAKQRILDLIQSRSNAEKNSIDSLKSELFQGFIGSLVKNLALSIFYYMAFSSLSKKARPHPEYDTDYLKGNL